MIELKRLKLINWHNFENVTFDCARLTYMIGVNAVGKTTILDAIRYCLTTNRNFNALGNKKSGRTLQGSVHAKQRGENAYRRPGHTVAYIGAEFYDSLKRTPFVIAVRVESEGPMQELHPGDQTWYLSEDGCTLEQLPFIDPKTGAFPGNDIASQTKQSLENIKAILESEGYTMADIVKTTCLLDSIADFGAMNEVYATFFADAAPARAAFEVGKLPKDALIEIEAVAYKD